jgi:hypothetical protein
MKLPKIHPTTLNVVITFGTFIAMNLAWWWFYHSQLKKREKELEDTGQIKL